MTTNYPDNTKTIRMPKADADCVLATLRAPENQERKGIGRLYNERTKKYCVMGAMQAAVCGGVSYHTNSNSDAKKENAYPACYIDMKWLKERGWIFAHPRTGFDRPAREPLVFYRDAWRELSALNDSETHRLSFVELADLIEKHLETY